MPLLVLIVIGFTTMTVLAVSAVSSAALQSQKIAAGLRKDIAQSSLRAPIVDDIMAWLTAGAPGPADAQALRARDDRLKLLAHWGTGIRMQEVTRGQFSRLPFAKGQVFAASPGGNSAHPFDALFGTMETISYSIGLSDDYLGEIPVSHSITVRETPACDIAFIAAERFSPAGNDIPITVNGIAAFPKGISSAAALGRLTANRIVASEMPAAFKDAALIHHANPMFQMSWGVPAPRYLASASNLAGAPSAQSYFDQAEVTLGVQSFGIIGRQIDGVELREFPENGPRRVVINLSVLPADVSRIYINCEGPSERDNGIVVIGDAGADRGIVRSIATNGRVWLWGDNNQPVAIASERGEWTLTDGDWSEASGASAPDLDLVWTGHLFSPGATNFTSPQAGTASQFTINGSLTAAGRVSGDVSGITINQQLASPLRQSVERVAYVYRLD